MLFNNRLLIQDLNTLYLRIVRDNTRKGILMTRRQICDIISRSPAPRLYITPEYAQRVLRTFPKYSARHYGSGGKHLELYNRYAALPPEERTLSNLNKIIDQPASSFYLSSQYIYRLLYKIYDKRK